VISLGVKAFGSLENASWAIFDAIAAPLASLFDYIDHPPRYDDLLGIQGNAPELHTLIPLNVNGVQKL
jgi:hypothetical protein